MGLFKKHGFVLKQGAHFRAISDMEFGPVIAVYHFHGGARQKKRRIRISDLVCISCLREGLCKGGQRLLHSLACSISQIQGHGAKYIQMAIRKTFFCEWTGKNTKQRDTSGSRAPNFVNSPGRNRHFFVVSMGGGETP